MGKLEAYPTLMASRPFYYTGFAPLLLTRAANRSNASANVAGFGFAQCPALPGV
jgi:hypothetical protein